jgi:cation diffusion facilitator CzcD-associated flavoprotein CzcO
VNTRQVVVIGAGPAGLAAAAELRRAGIPARVLERTDGVGASWRTRYDRLRLNSSRPFSMLPGRRYTGGRRWAPGTAMFPARDEVVRYLEDYARENRIDVRFSTRLERIDRDGEGWQLRTSTGDVYADQVIVAAGYTHSPWVPDWPGRDGFQGRLLHAADYRNAEPFQGADVLVVGPGSTGMEVAYDLVEHGAGRVRLAVRTPPNLLLSAPLGVLGARVFMKLPPRRADRLMRFVRAKDIGDLTEYGLPEPEEGIFCRLRRLGVAPAVVDKEMIEAIKERRIEIVAGVDSLDERAVELADGSRIEPDAVIAATGYRPALEPVVGHLGVLGDHGVPRALGADEAAPGLRFVGYLHLPGHLGYIGREARLAARAIARGWAAAPGARRGPRRSAAVEAA